MTATQDFSRVEFRSPPAPDSQWLEWFREEYGRRLYRIDFVPTSDAPMRMTASMRVLPDLAIARSRRSAMRASHDGDVNDDISFVLPLSAPIAIQTAGELHEVSPGSGWMGPHDEGAVLEVPEGAELLSVRLRRRLIEPLLSGLGHGTRLRDPAALRMLLAYLRLFELEEAIGDAGMRHVVTLHVHDLAALAFGAHRGSAELIEERGKRAGRLAAIKQDVLRRLGDPALSAAHIAARLRVTPRYVHKLFELEGTTFSEYVVGLRLLQAHRLLVDPRFSGRTVSAIALMVGFGDLSYFNRTFKRRFGSTPSEVRLSAPTIQ